MKITMLGFDEAEYFQVIHEMPLDWKRSVNAWVAVRKAINQARHLLRWYAKHGTHKQAVHYLREIYRIKERNGLTWRVR